jgi:hypothetical protein
MILSICFLLLFLRISFLFSFPREQLSFVITFVGHQLCFHIMMN